MRNPFPAQTLPHSHYTENYTTVAQNGRLPEKCNSDLHAIHISQPARTLP